MGWDGGGSVTLLYDFTDDRDAGNPDNIISATKFDALLADLASAIQSCLNVNGETTIAADINFGAQKITNLGAAAAATNAARADQVALNTLQYGGTTAGSSNTYTATMTFFGTLAEGARLLLKANHSNTGAATLNVNGGGAVAVVRGDGSTALVADDIVSGDFFEVGYDGTSWVMLSGPGMLASSVPTSVAEFRDDISGNLLTAGSSTAYTITTNRGFSSLTDGLSVSARMDETSGASPTLAVDGLAAKQIEQVSGTNMPTGALVAGAVYTFVYDSSADAWIVHGNVDAYMPVADNPDLAAIEALAGTDGALRKTAENTWTLDDGTTSLMFLIDGGGGEISTGIQGDIHVPFACTITGVYLLADQSGSITVDLWKDSYANFPPTDADSITASAVPAISSGTKDEDLTLTGWTTSVSAGDIIRVNVDSVTTIERCTVGIKVARYV